MQKYNYQQVQDYTAKQIFDLVMDIAKYPAFLPWVSKAKILASNNNIKIAELFVSFKGFGYSYISEVTYNKNGKSYYVTAKANNGLFKSLWSHWIISEIDDKSCKVDFSIQFQFKSRLLHKVVGGIFKPTAQQMLDRFAERAKEIYIQ